MRKGVIVVALVLFASMAWAQCVPGESGMVVDRSMALCAGTVAIADPLRVIGTGTVLLCDGTLFRGTGIETGVIIEGDGVQVQGCGFESLSVGIEVQGAGFSETGTSYQDVVTRSRIVTAEQVPPSNPPLPSQPQVVPPSTPPTTPPPTQPPAVPPAPTKPSTSIWEVANIKSEKLLENALQFEYDSTAVPNALIAERVALLQQTFKDLRIERQFIYRNGVTQVIISIKPERGFFRKVIYENITLYEYIPKSFAQLVDGVVFDGEQPTVLEKDPLLKKVIKKDEPLRFSYSATKDISEQCKELFRIIGVGMGRKELTLGSVWREQGVVQVLKEFPVESVALIMFIAIISFGGVWFKQQTHKVR